MHQQVDTRTKLCAIATNTAHYKHMRGCLLTQQSATVWSAKNQCSLKLIHLSSGKHVITACTPLHCMFERAPTHVWVLCVQDAARLCTLGPRQPAVCTATGKAVIADAEDDVLVVDNAGTNLHTRGLQQKGFPCVVLRCTLGSPGGAKALLPSSQLCSRSALFAETT
eukprot:GHRQ01035923.1.p1 GENE.GHRQ01035923.1~~GHRQ01035923.1.p1  ORF type:complete len:167 (+),score=3.32 GHRQ01035923.1:122-622(+)